MIMCTASEADPAWDNQEEKVDDEVTEQAEQWREQQEQVERSEVADTTELLKTISLELSSCVAPPFHPSPQQLPMSWEISAAIPEELSNSPKTLLLFFNDCFSFPTPTYPPGKSLQESQEEEAASWRSSQEETAIDLFPAQPHYTIHPN